VTSGLVGADETGLVALDRALRSAAEDASTHRRLVQAAAGVGADVDSVRRVLAVFESWCLDRAGDVRVRLVVLQSYLDGGCAATGVDMPDWLDAPSSLIAGSGALADLTGWLGHHVATADAVHRALQDAYAGSGVFGGLVAGVDVLTLLDPPHCGVRGEADQTAATASLAGLALVAAGATGAGEVIAVAVAVYFVGSLLYDWHDDIVDGIESEWRRLTREVEWLEEVREYEIDGIAALASDVASATDAAEQAVGAFVHALGHWPTVDTTAPPLVEHAAREAWHLAQRLFGG
jgi:hypothetical protein